MTVTLDEKYLLKWIPVKEIHELIKELNLTNGKGKKIGLNPFVKILNESNYVVIKQRKSIKNVRDTYYSIHKA